MKSTDTASNSKPGALARSAAYSMAAGAAVASGNSAAHAAVVYSGPQNINIGQFGSQDLNLDGDGFTDILLKNYVFLGGNYQGASVDGYPGKLVGFNNGLAYATALSAGAMIDSSTVGPGYFGSLAYGTNNPNAQFNNASGAFIGLSFPIGANDLAHTHYGWVRVTIDNAAGSFVINDWAYDDQAGAGIAAGAVPEPGTLGLLAAGAAGLAALRRRRAA